MFREDLIDPPVGLRLGPIGHAPDLQHVLDVRRTYRERRDASCAEGLAVDRGGSMGRTDATHRSMTDLRRVALTVALVFGFVGMGVLPAPRDGFA